MADCNTYNCPEDCLTPLPAVEFSDCNPETNEGEIVQIAVSKSDADDFTDIESLAEWTARVSANGTDPNAIRLLRVIGDKPAPEETTKVLSGRREVVTNRTHVLNVDIDETNDVNYQFMNATTCNGSYKIWYITQDGRIYGGTCGILATLRLNPIHTRGKGEHILFQGTVKWESLSHPVRNVFPLAS